MFHQRGLPEMLRPSPLVPRHNGPSNKHLALLVAWASRKSSVAMSTNYKKGRPSSTCALVIRTQGQIWAFYGTEKSKKRAKKRAAKKACKALYPEIKARVQAHHRRENRKLAMLKYSRRLLYYNLRW
ncbi:hypothetical protein JCM16303_006652 [Sporobolomyces ruberrimus]